MRRKTSLLLQACEGFEFDQYNVEKNLKKHNVTTKEVEEVFFDPRLVMTDDVKHSGAEDRYLAIGKTRKGRLLFVAFTIRDMKIRPISYRDLNKRREGELYEKTA